MNNSVFKYDLKPKNCELIMPLKVSEIQRSINMSSLGDYCKNRNKNKVKNRI
jgi:hypothetical protein